MGILPPRSWRCDGRAAAHLGVAAILLAFGAAAGSIEAADPAEVVEQIHHTSLDLSRVSAVGNLSVDLGQAELRIQQGLLIPATPVAGQAAELLFVGEAYFYLEPPDAIEASQLELFTGNGALNTLVDSAVLVIPNDEVVSQLLSKSGPGSGPDPEALERAQATFEAWVASSERRNFGIELAIFKDALGDTMAKNFFMAWCNSKALGRFFYISDPEQIEQVVVGQFVAMELDEVEEDRIRRRMRRGRRHGRYQDLRFEDLGNLDKWVSASERDASGGVVRGGHGFEPDHYELNVRFRKEDLRLSGTARIDLTAIATGRRALPLILHPDIKIRSVKDGEGNPLFWHRTTWETAVFLPQATSAGQPMRIVVEFAGNLLERLNPGEFSLLSTTHWYPHVGSIDRATYDVTFRWPKRLDLLTGGELEDHGEEKGVRWERRLLDVPSQGVSFEIGQFDVHTEQLEDVTLRVGILKTRERRFPGLRDQMTSAVRKSFKLYEHLFGDYPLDEFTFATGWRAASEAHLGFVVMDHWLIDFQRYAPGFIMVDNVVSNPRREFEKRRLEIVAHEIAHQWWGHKLGVYNYRDMWLGESLADFSVFLAYFGPLGRDPVARRALAGRARNALSEKASNGQSRESLGPIILGPRLNSSLDDYAYHSVVYEKGYLALSTLAIELGEGRFIDMLKTLVDSVSFRVIDTPKFLKAMERMSGKDLRPFARRFIHGTGVPTIFYDYEVSRDGEDDGWVIKGSGDQTVSVYIGTELMQTASGDWDAIKVFENRLDPANSRLTFPYEYTYKPYSKGMENGESELKVEKGVLVLDGREPSFELRVPHEPVRFQLDPERRVLAFLYRKDSAEKGAVRVRAARLVASGRPEEAIELLRDAVSDDESSDQGSPGRSAQDRIAREHSDLYLSLAHIYLDQGREDEARAAFEAAERSLPRLDRSRFNWHRVVLDARLALRRGDYRSAYAGLRKHMRLRFLQRWDDSVAEQLRRAKFKDGVWGDGQTYAMLAISAHHTGHEEVCRRATEEASARGANMVPFERVHQN